MSFQGSCSRCNQIGSLETAERLCKPCLIYKYEQYRNECLPQCSNFEHSLDSYKKQIDDISPMLINNLNEINQAKQLIDETYNNQLRNLNNERNGLLAILEECKRDNNKFFEFKNELNIIRQNIYDFKNPTQNLYQDNVVSTLIKRFEDSFGKAKNVEQNFQNLFQFPIKYIDKFESASSNQTMIGRLNLQQQTIRPNLSPIKTIPQIFAPHTQTANSAVSISNNISKWKQKANDNPFLEIAIDKIPSHLTSFRNYLFCLDDNGILLIFSFSSNNELEYKKNYKSPIKTVRNMAANLNYIAMTYINIDGKTCKKLNLKPCGVVLFPRNLDTVDFNTALPINSENFVHPVGIALSNEHIFVCDQILKTVFKINILNKQIEATFKVPEGNPYKLSINNEYLVLSDTAQHRLSLHKLSNLEMVNKLNIEQTDGKNGPYGVFLSNDNLVFFKNYESSQLVVVDMYLNNQAVFKKIPNGIEGFTMLECVQQFLVVGVIDKKKTKLICYLNN